MINLIWFSHSRFENYDPEEDDVLTQELKLAALDGIEAEWRSEHDSQGSQYSSWMSYGTSVVANIIENLQVQILDVHIRYEDDSYDFAAGIFVEEVWKKRLT